MSSVIISTSRSSDRCKFSAGPQPRSTTQFYRDFVADQLFVDMPQVHYPRHFYYAFRGSISPGHVRDFMLPTTRVNTGLATPQNVGQRFTQYPCGISRFFSGGRASVSSSVSSSRHRSDLASAPTSGHVSVRAPRLAIVSQSVAVAPIARTPETPTPRPHARIDSRVRSQAAPQSTNNDKCNVSEIVAAVRQGDGWGAFRGSVLGPAPPARHCRGGYESNGWWCSVVSTPSLCGLSYAFTERSEHLQ